MAGGWVCFVVSILIIGVLTAIIGDLATHVRRKIDILMVNQNITMNFLFVSSSVVPLVLQIR